MKEPKCKHCAGKHYSFGCYSAPRKAMKVNKPLQASRTPFTVKTPTMSSVRQKPLKRSKIASRSKNPRALLIWKLDRAFSVYIRLKDAVNGYARCVTCGAKAPWREMQNGHFISRRKMSTRWSELNCHVQCPICNTDLNGNLKVYEQYLQIKLGETELLKLKQKSAKSYKYTEAELQQLLEHYNAKINSLQGG